MKSMLNRRHRFQIVAVTRARKYLLIKCTVSSTTMPKVMDATTERPKPISPTVNPQIPKAHRAGTTFGTILIKLISTRRRAIKNTSEIASQAPNAAINILRMFCSEILAHTTDNPEPRVNICEEQ